ncbi:MAG: hypothetical protein JXA49_00555, partial [Actinobacteria bacterium]|nr:hypothetical protein [Actinomycetota bacterium]
MKRSNLRAAALISFLSITIMLVLAVCPFASAQPNVPGATLWYLAEGSTAASPEGVFETWVCISNSGPDDATTQLTYMTVEGEVEGPVVIVESGAAATVDVSLSVPDVWSVSTEVVSDEPVVVDRQMFWDTGVAVTGQPYHQCSHTSIGVNTPSDTWYLAEGSTGGNEYGAFETWVLLQNPGGLPATVNINYQTPTGEIEGPQNVELLPNSRQTFSVGETVPSQWSVSTSVVSDEPIIAERAMYWNSPHMKRQAAHDSIGVTAPSDTWYLAEGSTGGTPGERLNSGNFETW